MPTGWDTKRRRGAEFAAVVLLLFSAMLDPVLTFGLAAAVLAGGFVLVLLDGDRRRHLR